MVFAPLEAVKDFIGISENLILFLEFIDVMPEIRKMIKKKISNYRNEYDFPEEISLSNKEKLSLKINLNENISREN